MDARERKLRTKLKDPVLAKNLVRAGYTTPKKIKAAKDKDLEKAVGKDHVKRLKDKLHGK